MTNICLFTYTNSFQERKLTPFSTYILVSSQEIHICCVGYSNCKIFKALYAIYILTKRYIIAHNSYYPIPMYTCYSGTEQTTRCGANFCTLHMYSLCTYVYD